MLRKRLLAITLMATMLMTFMPSATFAAKKVKLKLTAKTTTESTVKLSWNKVKKAKKYVIYGGRLGRKIVKIKTISSKKNRTYTVKKISGNKLLANKEYKFYVAAYKGKKRLAKSTTKIVEVKQMFQLNFDANGGTGNMQSQESLKGADLTISTNGFTAPTGKEFYVWNTQKDGLGTSYIERGVIRLQNDTTLYAQWKDQSDVPVTPSEPITTALTLNHNDGTAATDTASITTGNTVVKSVPMLLSADAELEGWYSASDNGVKVLNPDGSFANDDVDTYIKSGKWAANTQTLILYAHWVKKEIKVVAKVNNYKGCTKLSEDATFDLYFYYDTKDYKEDDRTYVAEGLNNIEINSASSPGGTLNPGNPDDPLAGMVWWIYGDDGEYGWNINSKITRVIIDKSMQDYYGLRNVEGMFYEFFNADDIIGEEYLQTENVFNFGNMFRCFGLTSKKIKDAPNVQDWDMSNARIIDTMFDSYAKGSKTFNDVPDVSHWDTSKVLSMTGVFSNYAGESLFIDSVPNVKNWKTGRVTDMNATFAGYAYSSEYISLEVDVSEWDVSEVEYMGHMFESYAKSSEKSIGYPNLAKWKTDSLQITTYMFSEYAQNSGRKNDQAVKLSNFNTSKINYGQGDAEEMFGGQIITMITIGPNWTIPFAYAGITNGTDQGWMKETERYNPEPQKYDLANSFPTIGSPTTFVPYEEYDPGEGGG